MPPLKQRGRVQISTHKRVIRHLGIAQTNAETFGTAEANTAQSNAETYASDASNLSSGTVSNTVLPNVGTMTGVTIAPDPGTTPSGTFGQLFLYY